MTKSEPLQNNLRSKNAEVNMKYYQIWKMYLVCFPCSCFFFYYYYFFVKIAALSKSYKLKLYSVYIYIYVKKIQKDILGSKLLSNTRIQILVCEFNGMFVINFIY